MITLNEFGMIINASRDMIDVQTLVPISPEEDTHLRICSDLRGGELKYIAAFYHEKGDENKCIILKGPER